MSSTTLFYAPRFLLTLVALITAIVPYIADYNETHVFNPKWPGHARFHNGQTMSMGVYLGVLTLWKTWFATTTTPTSTSSKDGDNLWTASVIAAAYYITQFSAYYYPGATAWDAPQHYFVPYTHMLVVMPMLSIIGVAFGLEQWRVGWTAPVGQVAAIGAVGAVVLGLFLKERTRVAMLQGGEVKVQ